MKTVLTWSALLFAVANFAQAAPPASRTISSHTDKFGQHPATAELHGPATITCVTAQTNVANPQPIPTCAITAPGYSGVLAPGKSAESSGAGMVVLTCDGQGRLVTCSASIKQ